MSTYRRSKNLTKSERWEDEAACKGVGPEIFYPDIEAEEGPARHFCNNCSVTEECREFAATNKLDGIWGNTNERERRKSGRRRKAG